MPGLDPKEHRRDCWFDKGLCLDMRMSRLVHFEILFTAFVQVLYPYIAKIILVFAF